MLAQGPERTKRVRNEARRVVGKGRNKETFLKPVL